MTIDVQALKQVFYKQSVHKKDVAPGDAQTRRQKLAKLRDAITANHDAIKQALFRDLGKPVTAEPSFEAMMVLGDIEEAMASLDDWMKPTEVAVRSGGSDARAYIKYEPRGQVLIMSAWNFPFSLALSPLVAAIAAGNTAVIKTNEMAPATAKVIANLIEACFGDDEVAVFTGDVREAIALQELPFDHVFFTGSPEVGKSVMAAAAKHLTSVTLELGGKCPALIDENSDFDVAVQNVAVGRSFNLGQTCLCIDYAIVPESMRDRFVQGVAGLWQAMYYRNGQYNREANSRMVDVRNFRRVKGYIDDAVARGATIACGGVTDEAALIIEPTILLDVPTDAAIMKHEIFGPVLPVLSYRDKSEAVEIVNALTKPLGMYIYSRDDAFVQYVLDRTSSGGVTVNGWANHYFESNLPFGGVNHSGHGSYHGIHGFRELSHARSVFRV
jgi:aldehyde dehydrogenase (NAD+)